MHRGRLLLDAPGGPRTPFTFYAQAHLTPRKGFDILIRAFARQFRGDSMVRLVIGGDGVIRSDLEALADSSGLPVIGTRCGGPEGFIDDRVGLLLEPGDEDGLARALVTLRRAPEFDPQAVRGTRFAASVTRWSGPRLRDLSRAANELGARIAPPPHRWDVSEKGRRKAE